MLARDVMSRNVVTVRPNMTTRAAAAVLVVHGFASAPVVTAEGVLRGIVTEADLLRGQPLPNLTHISTATDITAGEAMTPNPRTMRPIDDLSDIVAVMLDDGLRSVPIVEDGRLVGIISRRDILRCIARRELVPHGAVR
jgi:CBS domain-containing protein